MLHSPVTNEFFSKWRSIFIATHESTADNFERTEKDPNDRDGLLLRISTTLKL